MQIVENLMKANRKFVELLWVEIESFLREKTLSPGWSLNFFTSPIFFTSVLEWIKMMP